MTIYLYIKQHTITGLKYFGKTTKVDPYKYLGSGSYWQRHIKTHGKEHVITCQLFTFESQEECTKFALEFSKTNNIVESKEWANFRNENGLDGVLVGNVPFNKGKSLSEKHKIKIGNANRGKHQSKEANEKRAEANRKRQYKPHTQETKDKMSLSAKKRKSSNETKRKISESITNAWAKRKSNFSPTVLQSNP